MKMKNEGLVGSKLGSEHRDTTHGICAMLREAEMREPEGQKEWIPPHRVRGRLNRVRNDESGRQAVREQQIRIIASGSLLLQRDYCTGFGNRGFP
jgi:hypothetical protein